MRLFIRQIRKIHYQTSRNLTCLQNRTALEQFFQRFVNKNLYRQNKSCFVRPPFQCMHNYCTKTDNPDKPASINQLSPVAFRDALKKANIDRCFILNLDDRIDYSHQILEKLIPLEQLKALEYEHEAIFFEIGARTNSLMAVFIWKTNRGQASGGVDFKYQPNMADFIQHGCRFSKTLGVKCALAGLWSGGGKGIIAAPEEGSKSLASEFRRKAFMDFGEFLTTLNGCFIAGYGVGGSVEDTDTMFSQTRYVSNLSPDYGGSSNSYHYTALGVIKSMEAALTFLNLGTLKGKTVAIQGAGRVGEVIIGELLQKGVANITVSETNSFRAEDVRQTFAEITLDQYTIPMLDTKIICGSSNFPVHSVDDLELLKKNNILYVTDVVPNRMGIVANSLEMYGRMEDDPELKKHLSYDWEHSIYRTTLRILEAAAEHNIYPKAAADMLGKKLSLEINPWFPGRTQNIIRGLKSSGWNEGRDFWRERWSY
ncbi:leucine dehydrogenase-like isoform X2 [Dreissena polymorpha]|uniref:leucine dehydrogenase-like isoform X2 n=1 Tax=Dreissena polymorpha TaxID=45954 RepID=UPI002264932B|nr:leucine dehydrogenase-like isoform X2 [Dreissena polymorpha]